jgi:hypothetical protein
MRSHSHQSSTLGKPLHLCFLLLLNQIKKMHDELFLVLFPTPDERKEKYGIKHWLVSSRGRETYRREITIIENSMVVSDAT